MQRLAQLGLWVALGAWGSCAWQGNGDRGRFGCPSGEVCSPTGSPDGGTRVQFAAASTRRCGIDGLWGMPVIGGSGPITAPTSIAVALGGWTSVSVVSGPEAGVSRTSFSEHFEHLEGTSSARGAVAGTGRFSAYDVVGHLVDYLVMPVVPAVTATALDELACPGDARALLRGHPFRPRVVVLADDGTALVDTHASARTLAGEADVVPGPRSERILLRLRFGADQEVIDAIDVVDSIDRVEMVPPPGGAPLALSWAGHPCFQAFAGDAAVLGVQLDEAYASDPEVLEVEPAGACATVFDLRQFTGAPAPASTTAITVTLGGVTASFSVELPEILPAE